MPLSPLLSFSSSLRLALQDTQMEPGGRQDEDRDDSHARILYPSDTSMQPGISTHVLLQQRLHPGHLDAFAQAGARHIEIFAARHHFDYTDRSAVRDIAAWFRSNDVTPTLHQPLYLDDRWTRHTAPTLNLISLSKPQRIEAMEEIKRAIESAEQIPVPSIVIHLGLYHDASGIWSEQAIEHSLTAIEHLKAFAAPLGVRLLLENLPNEVATPAHLLETLKIGHFDNVGICLNLGHAHLAPSQKTDGILPALDLLKSRIAILHLSDNDARADQHLWPFAPEKDGVDWPAILPHLNTLPKATPAIIEITHDTNEDLDTICKHFITTQDTVRRLEDSLYKA